MQDDPGAEASRGQVSGPGLQLGWVAETFSAATITNKLSLRKPNLRIYVSKGVSSVSKVRSHPPRAALPRVTAIGGGADAAQARIEVRQ